MGENSAKRVVSERERLPALIDALLASDAEGILVPHGVGGLARELLSRAAAALRACPPTAAGTVMWNGGPDWPNEHGGQS